jgi:hypothetical protein
MIPPLLAALKAVVEALATKAVMLIDGNAGGKKLVRSFHVKESEEELKSPSNSLSH